MTIARQMPEGKRVDRSSTVQIETCNALMEPAAFAPHIGPYFPKISDLAQEANRLRPDRSILAFADADVFTYIRREQPNFLYRGAREMCIVVRGYPVYEGRTESE